MPDEKSAASSAAVYVNGPARFWLDGELVVFEMPSGTNIVCGAMSASNFIESFSRAAEIAHQWSNKHYCGSGDRFQPKTASQTSSVADKSKPSSSIPPN